MPDQRTRLMCVVAQDPGVLRSDGHVLTAQIPVAWEELEPGPVGARVHLVDYDAESRVRYRPASMDAIDGPAPVSRDALLADPGLHAVNAYALVMRTLGRFEAALGRRVSWGFSAPQLKIAPHAFEEANAYYSREAQSLLFGYFRRDGALQFMALSHDIVVHEATHALLDGIRLRFMRPSSVDQAAFHEAFADIVALLSVYSLEGALQELLKRPDAAATSDDPAGGVAAVPEDRVSAEQVTLEALVQSVLFGLADDAARDRGARVRALRRSVELEPADNILSRLEFREAHRRGEVLVAATMRAFLDAWTDRIHRLGRSDGHYDLQSVADAGAQIADQLLTMAIRALDYTPPIHLGFGDYLSALMTADAEVSSDARLRTQLREWFARYGITPASETADGLWEPAEPDLLRHEGVRLGNLQSDPVEMFRLVWANRAALDLAPAAFTRVTSVRPCVRTSPDDGLPVRETVAEVIQYVRIPASDLDDYGLTAPAGMPAETHLELEGGSTLIFDEFARLKYQIHNRLPIGADDARRKRWQDRLEYLFHHGTFDDENAADGDRLAQLHRLRAGEVAASRDEVW